jgi:hypothetical protein
VSVAGPFFIFLVFLISPALSNYGVMNLFLFAELLAYGFYLASLGGQNLHAGAAMFFIVATVGLDAEKPSRFKPYSDRTFVWCCRYSLPQLLAGYSGQCFPRPSFGNVSLSIFRSARISWLNHLVLATRHNANA